jgi:hypothetical protein
MQKLEEKPETERLSLVRRSKKGIFTVATWADDRKTFAISGDDAQAVAISPLTTVTSGI